MPGEQIEQDVVFDISKVIIVYIFWEEGNIDIIFIMISFLFTFQQVAALLHRAADMDQKPSIKETKFLLPKPALSAKDIKPPQWVNMVYIIFFREIEIFLRKNSISREI